MIIIEAPDTIRLPFDSPAGPLLLIRGDLARRLLTGSPELTARACVRAMGAVSRAPVSRIIGARPDPGVAIRLFTVSSSDGRRQDRCRERTAGCAAGTSTRMIYRVRYSSSHDLFSPEKKSNVISVRLGRWFGFIYGNPQSYNWAPSERGKSIATFSFSEEKNSLNHFLDWQNCARNWTSAASWLSIKQCAITNNDSNV